MRRIGLLMNDVATGARDRHQPQPRQETGKSADRRADFGTLRRSGDTVPERTSGARPQQSQHMADTLRDGGSGPGAEFHQISDR
jgi:hypothetical protein